MTLKRLEIEAPERFREYVLMVRENGKRLFDELRVRVHADSNGTVEMKEPEEVDEFDVPPFVGTIIRESSAILAAHSASGVIEPHIVKTEGSLVISISGECNDSTIGDLLQLACGDNPVNDPTIRVFHNAVLDARKYGLAPRVQLRNNGHVTLQVCVYKT